jgi:hypothetical protein
LGVPVLDGEDNAATAGEDHGVAEPDGRAQRVFMRLGPDASAEELEEWADAFLDQLVRPVGPEEAANG